MVSYRLQRGETITSELRRIAADQTDAALAELEKEDVHEAIHQVRRRCKKVRALLRFVRRSNQPLYERENAAYRDAARRVADLRETTGLIEAFDLICARHVAVVDVERFAPIRNGLLRLREEITTHRLETAILDVRSDLEAARERIPDWSVRDEGFDALAGGLAKTYGRARNRMADAFDERTLETFHEWRKQVKYHRYHIQLMQDCWKPIMKARRDELHELSDLLGVDHDLGQLRLFLHEAPDRFGGTRLVGGYTALLDRRRAQLQLQARGLGERLFVASADDFARHVRRYWDVWTTEPGEEELLPDKAVEEYSPSSTG